MIPSIYVLIHLFVARYNIIFVCLNRFLARPMCAQPLQTPLEQGITARGAIANKTCIIPFSYLSFKNLLLSKVLQREVQWSNKKTLLGVP